MEYTIYLFFIVFLFGAIVGSFLNVVILRLPQEGGSVVFPASHCPKCKHPLASYDNIPIISYIFLRGKCRYCKCRISIQYPIVELTMGLLSICLFHQFGLTITSLGYFFFLAALLVIIVIDMQLQIIPDKISLPGIVLGLAFSFINPLVTPLDSLIGTLAGGGFLYAIAWGYLVIRKQEGMGGGDIKLLAMLGAWLGWQSLLFIVFFSSFIGAIIGVIAIKVQKEDSSYRIPFGPFLSGAAICFLFFSTEIIHYFTLYLNGQWP
ncbi:MAG: prepilin peptidase [Desulfotalea sp.]